MTLPNKHLSLYSSLMQEKVFSNIETYFSSIRYTLLCWSLICFPLYWIYFFHFFIFAQNLTVVNSITLRMELRGLPLPHHVTKVNMYQDSEEVRIHIIR